MTQLELAGGGGRLMTRSSEAGERAWPAAVALTGFAILLVLVGRRHEPWFDEAQAWLLARDSSLWDLLAHRVGYEGTPGLWHCILWVAVHCGFPFGGFWLISAAFAVAGAGIVLRKAPFPFWLRLGAIFSYFFAYQYAIVARSYALDLVFIPLLAVMFAGRMHRPRLYCLVLGLCANANAYSFVIASVLFAEFGWAHLRAGVRHPRFILACAIFALLAIAAALQALPPPDVSFGSASVITPLRGVEVVREAFLDRPDVFGPSMPVEIARKAGFLLSVVLLLPSLLLFRRAGTLDLVGGLIIALLLFCVVEFANVWHAGMLYLVWILGLWISWDAVRRSPAWLSRSALASTAALLLVNSGYTVAAWTRELGEPYSAGPAAADLLMALRASHPGARIAGMGFNAFSVQPWLPANIFDNYNDGAAAPAYYAWLRAQSFRPDANLASWKAMIASPRYDALVLSAHELEHPPEADYVAAATQGGFCPPARIPGGMIWKSYVRDSDALLIFLRCPAP